MCCWLHVTRDLLRSACSWSVHSVCIVSSLDSSVTSAFWQSMSAESQPLLLDRKESSGYTKISRSDSYSSLDYLKKNTSTTMSSIKKYVAVYNKALDKATYPWKLAVKKLYAKEFLAEFLGTFLLVVSKTSLHNTLAKQARCFIGMFL